MPMFSFTKKNPSAPSTPRAPAPFSTFAPADAKGGSELVTSKTALVCIEFQNEFTTEGGKLHGAVKPVMEATDMLAKTVATAEAVRAAGGVVLHTPIMFRADASDNPNKALGILAGCANDSLFTEGTWNCDFCKEMVPKEADLVVRGKKGLDAFPNTNLEELLVSKGIETVVLCGFLTNCCVESTMRTACEKGFNVITLTDCCATTSAEGHAAASAGTFGMFSVPMSAADFQAKLTPPAAVESAAKEEAAEAPVDAEAPVNAVTAETAQETTPGADDTPTETKAQTTVAAKEETKPVDVTP